MEVGTNDSSSATALQPRLSKLQAVWDVTTKEDDELQYANGISANTGMDDGAEDAEEEPQRLSFIPCAPCKPVIPQLASPRPFRRHVAATTSLTDGDSALDRSTATSTNVSRGSISFLSTRGSILSPHTPAAPHNGTPRVRARSRAGTPSLSSVLHMPALLPTLLPSIDSYAGPATTCACCGECDNCRTAAA